MTWSLSFQNEPEASLSNSLSSESPSHIAVLPSWLILPPAFPLPSRAPVPLHRMFPTSPAWNLALCPGHISSGRPLCGCCLFLRFSLLSYGWKGEVTVLLASHHYSQGIKLATCNQNLSSAVLLDPLKSLSMTCQHFARSFIHIVTYLTVFSTLTHATDDLART